MTAMEVDEKPKEVESTKEETEEEKVVELTPGQTAVAAIKQAVGLLEKGVIAKENRFSTRVVRGLASIRKKLTPDVLSVSIGQHLSEESAAKKFMLDFLSNVDDKELLELEKETSKSVTPTTTPEVEIYLQLLVLIWLLDQKQIDQSIACADDLVSKVEHQTRRSLDVICAKVYFYYARAYEVAGRSSQIRKSLTLALRTASLRRNDEGQSTLINLLLRNYITHNLYDSAAKLISKCNFPEAASNNEWARFHYYQGRANAIQLKYKEANNHLEEALRKAPQNSAYGFQQEVMKWSIIVQLLLGRIPERSVFRRPHLARALTPYLHIALAVHQGDIEAFGKAIEKYADKFRAAKIYNLIMRCRHNVLKTGVLLICTSYSRISLSDICQKLHLDSVESAESIVAQAIRHGVISATINHVEGYVQTKETHNTYHTVEPQNEFHQRIMFCMDIHNDSVKRMRFPANDYRSDLETAEERRLRELQEKELAQEMAEDDEDY